MYIPAKRKIIVKKCEMCGSNFEAAKCGANTKRFCSNKCRAKNHKKLTQSYKECKHCGNEFLSNHNARKFCSDECSQSSTAAVPYLIHSRDEFRCIYCGSSSIEDGAKLHIDHIYPRSKGGKDIASNLVTACSHCNTSKTDRVLTDEAMERVVRYAKKLNKEKGIPDSKEIKLWGK